MKNHGDKFSYEVYKSTEPHWTTFNKFLDRHLDGAWRLVLHGRAMTSGKVNRDTAHPIKVDCDDGCEFDWVVHNGSVRKRKERRADLLSDGHTFNTHVDTELIPHFISELPDTVEDHSRSTYEFTGNLNYLVFSEDGILVRMGQRYHMTDDFLLTCSLYDKFDDYEDHGFERGNDNEWALITPDGADPEIELKERQVYSSNRSSRSGASSGSSSGTTHGSHAGAWQDYVDESRPPSPQEMENDELPADPDAEVRDDEKPNADKYTITYKDHSEWEHISAVKVAPGVMRITNTMEGKTEYIKREQDPRSYFWYAPDPTPDNLDELEMYANSDHDLADEDTEQVSLEDFDTKNEMVSAVVSQTARTIASEVDGIDLFDIAEISDEVLDAAKLEAMETTS